MCGDAKCEQKPKHQWTFELCVYPGCPAMASFFVVPRLGVEDVRGSDMHELGVAVHRESQAACLCFRTTSGARAVRAFIAARFAILIAIISPLLGLAAKVFFGSHGAKLKPVPQSLLSDYVKRMRWVVLDFLAQLIDHYAQIFCFGGVIRSPHSLQDGPVGKRLSLVNYEETQDVKFFRGQMNSIAAHHD